MPVPVSLNVEHHVVAGRHADVAAHAVRAEFHIGGFDFEPSAARHGVARVDGEVHEDLIHLAGVDVDVGEIGRQARHQLHVFTDEADQHLPQLLHHLVEVDHARLRRPAGG